jgi:hypothetical protein
MRRPVTPLRSLVIHDSSSPLLCEADAASSCLNPPPDLFGPSPLAPPPAPRVAEMTPDEKALFKVKLGASLSSLRRRKDTARG